MRSSGRPETGWHAYCLSLLPREVLGTARMLVIGRSSEWLEQFLTRRNVYSRCDVIGYAARPSSDGGHSNGKLHVLKTNLNAVELPSATYDAVWSDESLFGVRDLQRLSAQIARALKPEGLFFAYEYVGPGQVAIGRAQREAIAAAHALIPRRFRSRGGTRTRKAPSGNLRNGKRHDDLTATTPPARIVPILREHFRLLQCRALGGTILQFVLRDIAGNFRSDDRTATSVLEMLFSIEDALIDSGELPSDFALIVAKPK